MKWVRTTEQLPEPRIRVLVGMHVKAPIPIVTGGAFYGDHWVVDMITRPVSVNEVAFWAPIAPFPKD